MLKGRLNYLAPGAKPSLFRNGCVLARRDLDGSDGGLEGVHPQGYELAIHDARGLAGDQRKTCDRNGFELLDAPLGDPSLDFFDHDTVTGRYYGECAELVAQATGASAFAFDHNIRSAIGKKSQQRIKGGQTVQGPAKMVHGDYTLTSAPQRLQDLSQPPGANDTLRALLGDGESLIAPADAAAALADDGRFAIINVWRNIAQDPVQRNPMAMCDGQTVAPEDLVTFEIHYQDRIGENYFALHNEQHAFYSFPEMTRDEPMLLKQWDSAGGLARANGARGDNAAPDQPCTFSFHSAFDDLAAPEDAPDRWSIEVRCLVLY